MVAEREETFDVEAIIDERTRCDDAVWRLYRDASKPGGNPLLRKTPKVVSFPLPSGLQTTFQRPPRGSPPEVSRCPETVREGESECSEAGKGHICWKVGRVASQEQFGSDLGQTLTSEGSKNGSKCVNRSSSSTGKQTIPGENESVSGEKNSNPTSHPTFCTSQTTPKITQKSPLPGRLPVKSPYC